MKKAGKFMDLLFGQHAIDQARAAHSKKQHALPGDRNQLLQARVLHQSDLPRLLAAREEQAQKDSGTRTRKGKKQAKGKEQASKQSREPASPADTNLFKYLTCQAPTAQVAANTTLPSTHAALHVILCCIAIQVLLLYFDIVKVHIYVQKLPSPPLHFREQNWPLPIRDLGEFDMYVDYVTASKIDLACLSASEA
ncbi:uncharacterized protein UDID_18360 [Ustilago sp. UG-2017a]|nr:uncharacterized protein UDID_18360 [Ustilago sp. UG-2017a]